MSFKHEIMDPKERGDKIHVDENMSDHGKENDLWTCSDCLEFFADFIFFQNQEFLASKGPFSGGKTKRYGRRR